MSHEKLCDFYLSHKQGLDRLSPYWELLYNADVRAQDMVVGVGEPAAINCELQLLPYLLDRKWTEHLCRYYKESCKVVTDVLLNWVPSNIDEVSTFYGMELDEYFLMNNINHPFHDVEKLIMRGDFIFDGNCFWSIENNIGTGIGGMDIVYHQLHYIERIRKYVPPAAIYKSDYKPLETMVAGIVQQACENGLAKNGRLNCLFQVDTSVFDYMSAMLTLMYQAELKRRGIDGKLFLTVGKPDIAGKGGYLFYKNEKIDVVDFFYNRDVAACYLDLNVLCIENLMLTLLSNKQSSQILYHYKERIDNDFVKTPRSFSLSEQQAFPAVAINGLLPQVIDEKDKFVLKPIDGEGGKGVLVGRDISDEQWQVIIEKDDIRKRYLVQEFIPSLPIQAIHGGQFTEHHSIWSTFYAAGENCGSMARIAPVARQNHVINASAGSETIVLETH